MKQIYLLFLCLVFFGCSSNGDDSGAIDSINPDNPIDTQSGIIPCENGMAGDFPCSGYDLLARLTLSQLSAGSANDIWGWTDSTTNKEYALVGLNNGTAFVNISEDDNPIFLGKLPSVGGSSPWRDIKIYQDYAFTGF